MSNPEAHESKTDTLTMEHLLFMDGLRAMIDTLGANFPITSSTTAHLTSDEGKHTLESRGVADRLLHDLAAGGEVARGDCFFVGGDPHQTYVLPNVAQSERVTTGTDF